MQWHQARCMHVTAAKRTCTCCCTCDWPATAARCVGIKRACDRVCKRELSRRRSRHRARTRVRSRSALRCSRAVCSMKSTVPSKWCVSGSVRSPCALRCQARRSQMPSEPGGRRGAVSIAPLPIALRGDQACRAARSKRMRARRRASRTLERRVSAAAAMTRQPSSTARSARTPALCQSSSARRIRARAAACPVRQEQSAASSRCERDNNQ